jgi:PAS domain S-box-containing protein
MDILSKQDPGDEPRALRVLHIEDDPRDARLFRRHLERTGHQLEIDLVASPDEFIAALHRNSYDVILADHGLPGWSGPGALDLLQSEGLDIPFILLTGTVGEDVAVEMIKRGASDYVLKDRPARLYFAIQRALEEKAGREEQRKSERSRDLLASLVETSDDTIVGIDLDGIVLSWNRGATNMYGYAAEEILGRSVSVLIAPESGAAFEQAVARLRRGESVARYESTGIRKDGRSIQVMVSISPIREADGRLAGASAIVRDVTQEKQLRQELFAAQKMEAVGRLAAGIAHDFNNLLTVVNGYSEHLLGQIAESDRFHTELFEINKAGQRAANLTRQLLAFSRKQILQPRVLKLNTIVKDIGRMLGRLLAADIAIAMELDPNLGAVRADPGQIEQVIMNLAVNAGDAMPLGGSLTISTANVDCPNPDPKSDGALLPCVMLALADTGVGIDHETQAQIFEPFFTTKEPGRGTGLGLSTVFGIVQQSGGSISVESQLGSGSTFRVFLPRVAEEGTGAAPAELPTTLAKGVETVLIVEDDAAVLTFISTILKSDEYTVLYATNGQDAVNLCERHSGSINLLITDMVMPGMSGAEVALRVSALRPETKILFISGYADDELFRRAESVLPRPAILTKPFSPADLSRKVREVLGES